jgi:hypothetical protein
MRPRRYSEDTELHRVSFIWSKALWKEIQQLALDLDTTGTDLVLEAVEQFLESKKKEVSKEKKLKR